MVAAFKRYNGGRVLVFVMGAFAEMPEDVSRIYGIIAQDLAWTHVSYYNDDDKRTKGMYRQRIQKAWAIFSPTFLTFPGLSIYPIKCLSMYMLITRAPL